VSNRKVSNQIQQNLGCLAIRPSQPANALAIPRKSEDEWFTAGALAILNGDVLNSGQVSGFVPPPVLMEATKGRKWPISEDEVKSLVWPDAGQVTIPPGLLRKEEVNGDEDYVRVLQLRERYEKSRPQLGLEPSMPYSRWAKIRDGLLKNDRQFREFYLRVCFFKPMVWVELNQELFDLIVSEGNVTRAVMMQRNAGRLVEHGCYFPQENSAIHAFQGIPYSFSKDGTSFADAKISNLSLKCKQLGRWGVPYGQALLKRQEAKLAIDTMHKMRRASSHDVE